MNFDQANLPAAEQDIRKAYADIEGHLKQFSLDSFNDPAAVARYLQIFPLDKLCRQIEADRLESKHSALARTVAASQEKPFEPEYDDLCRLHYVALRKKAINILEFGSGFSTVILAEALQRLEQRFGDYARSNFRVDKSFHVYSVEEEQRFLDITRNRLSALSDYATVNRSSVEMILHDNRIATIYHSLPDICPDFIYLDGPSLFGTTAELNGFTLNNQCRMPMSADILRIEFFLEPGTFILVDGRTANARFLRAYLKRNWAYRHDPIGDIHYFELQEAPLGPVNQRKLAFCLDQHWLLPSA